jgi:hypothetical protein
LCDIVSWSNISEIGHHLLLCIPAYLIDENQSSEIQSMAMDINYLIDIELTDWSINDQPIVTKIYGQFYRLLLASVLLAKVNRSAHFLKVHMYLICIAR